MLLVDGHSLCNRAGGIRQRRARERGRVSSDYQWLKAARGAACNHDEKCPEEKDGSAAPGEAKEMISRRSVQPPRQRGYRLRRRELLFLSAAAATLPCALHAQQQPTPVIGYL